MAFSNGCVFEVNGGTGSDTANGGGFDPSATFATDGAATSATGSSPVFTSASYNFTNSDVGAYLFIKFGTNWIPGWYKIASVASNAATLTASISNVVLYNGLTPVNATAGCASTASPGSATWGVDYSRSGSPIISYTDMVIQSTTTKYTSAGNPVGPNIVGNFISVTSGTNFTVQRVEVLSVSGTTATCDKSLGTASATGGHGGLGGALASPGQASTLTNGVTYCTIFVVGNNTYTFSNTANGSGGYINTVGGNLSIIGYMTNRYHFNTDGTRPIFQSNANSISLVAVNNTHCSFENISCQNGNSNTGITGWNDVNAWGTDVIWNCVFNSLLVGATVSDQSITQGCWFENCTSTTSPLQITSANWTIVRDCVFTGNSGLQLSPTMLERCIFYNTSQAGMSVTGSKYISHCIFHTLSGNSMVVIGTTTQSVTNCIFYNCTGTSSEVFNWTSINNNVLAINCAFGSNTANGAMPSSPNGLYSAISGNIVITGDPCNNASGGDFSLNNTANEGALCRITGFPTEFANALTANYLDVGPVQHSYPAAGGPVSSNFRGGFNN